MGRSGLAGPSMENHMDMSHLQMPKHMSVPQQDEPSDLEELEQFAKAFKQRRIKLGFTQVKWKTKTPKMWCPYSCWFKLISILINYWLLFFPTGRCWPCDGKTLREWLQPDNHLPFWGPEPQLQEHVQTQTSAGEVAQWRRYETEDDNSCYLSV